MHLRADPAYGATILLTLGVACKHEPAVGASPVHFVDRASQATPEGKRTVTVWASIYLYLLEYFVLAY